MIGIIDTWSDDYIANCVDKTRQQWKESENQRILAEKGLLFDPQGGLLNKRYSSSSAFTPQADDLIPPNVCSIADFLVLRELLAEEKRKKESQAESKKRNKKRKTSEFLDKPLKYVSKEERLHRKMKIIKRKTALPSVEFLKNMEALIEKQL